MMRSLFSAVSGLKNHQTRMDVIGNNIANVNTIGFKAGRVTFQDTLSQTLQGASAGNATTGGSNPMQIGLGMGVASVDTLFTTGSPQPTGNPTDLCLNGQGFFAVKDGSNVYYTRAGNFGFDTAGNFVIPGTGQQVMGYLGNVTTGVIDKSAIVPITVPTSASVPAKATDTLTLKANLSDTDVAGTREFATTKAVYDSKGNAYSVDMVFAKPMNTTAVNFNGSTLDSTSTTPTSQQIYVGDSKGILHALTVQVTPHPGATPTWDVDVKENGTSLATYTGKGLSAMNAGWNVSSGDIAFTLAYPGAGVGSYKAGTVSYTDNGTVTPTPSANTWYWAANSSNSGITVSNPTPPANLAAFTQNGAYSSGGGNLALHFTNGANDSSVTVDMTGLTQFSSATSVTSDANGYTDGQLNNTVIDSNGVIVGKFTNGQQRNLGQVVTMMCDNPQGLTKVGDNLYAESSNSGKMDVLKDSTMTVGALEMSNVDLSSEFSNMIITQRGFQANSKIISVDDEMLQDLTNLKR